MTEEVPGLMNDRYAVLLQKAKQVALSPQEIEMVAKELQKGTPETDPYTLLHILGRSQAKSHRQLVERFLDRKDDPQLAKLALQVLCSHWQDTSRYTTQVLRFLHGVSWDETGDCQLVASSIAGEYLRSHDEPHLLRELLRILEDTHERLLLRVT